MLGLLDVGGLSGLLSDSGLGGASQSLGGGGDSTLAGKKRGLLVVQNPLSGGGRMTMPSSRVLLYAAAGAALAFLTGPKRKRTGSLLKGALLGGGTAFLAQRVGLNLPGLPAARA